MSREDAFASDRPVDTPPSLIAALRDPRCYPHPVDRVEMLETHISWVLLTGPYAYKIKKPVNLGFLDFSTLENRLACCNLELELNRRLAPQLYLDVVSISGNPERPRVGAHGPAIEYAVKMVQFGQDRLASRLLKTGGLTLQHIERLAEKIAEFHAHAAKSSGGEFGSPREVLAAAMQNFDQIEKLPGATEDRAALAELRDWTRRDLAARRSRFESRRDEGRVRECHGDLHLGNITLIDGELTPFDCIEFSAALRWIDTVSEVAFLVMDLIDRGRPDFAHLFLSSYLEIAGDYDGIDLLRFYLVYRAMVRAKVHCIRACQLPAGTSEHQRLLDAYRGYLVLAERFTRRSPPPALIILNGLSGSGKSTAAQMLLRSLGAIRIRSDVERKRMHDMNKLERSGGGIDEGIYSGDTTRRVYQHLAQRAREIAAAGYRVIVDAAFLKRWQRDLLRDSARESHLPFVIVALQCSENVLRTRIAQRRKGNADASDADLAVLSHQIATHDPIAPDERDCVVAIDSALPLESLEAALVGQPLIERLEPPAPRPVPGRQ